MLLLLFHIIWLAKIEPYYILCIRCGCTISDIPILLEDLYMLQRSIKEFLHISLVCLIGRLPACTRSECTPAKISMLLFYVVWIQELNNTFSHSSALLLLLFYIFWLTGIVSMSQKRGCAPVIYQCCCPLPEYNILTATVYIK